MRKQETRTKPATEWQWAVFCLIKSTLRTGWYSIPFPLREDAIRFAKAERGKPDVHGIYVGRRIDLPSQ